MFEIGSSIQGKDWDSACRRFAQSHNLEQLASELKMSPQVLRNKLNPEQPHQITISDLLKITYATNDYTLIDGALVQLGRLPSTPNIESQPVKSVPAHMMNINAMMGDINRDALEVNELRAIPQSTRNRIVNSVHHTVCCLLTLACIVEQRFHTVPALSAAVDTVISSCL